MAKISVETVYGSCAASIASIPFSVASTIASFHHSSPEHIDPLRTMNVLGIPDFFDHAGNFAAGDALACVAAYAGTIVCSFAESDSTKKKIIITASVAGAGLATGANVAHEAGYYVPPYHAKPEGSSFDGQDALYGSAAGVFLASVFCATSLIALAHKNRRSRGTK